MRLALLLLFSFLPASAQVDPGWLHEAARRLVGYPYLFGGEGRGGFDCSGLVRYLYRHLGVSLPRTSREQYQVVARVDRVLPGDLLFFSEGRRVVDHVGVYLYPDPRTGELLMLHASGRWGRVVVEPLSRYQSIFVGAGRVYVPQGPAKTGMEKLLPRARRGFPWTLRLSLALGGLGPTRSGKGSPPRYPTSPALPRRRASVRDPRTWGSLEEAHGGGPRRAPWALG